MKRHITNTIIMLFALYGFYQFIAWTNTVIPELIRG